MMARREYIPGCLALAALAPASAFAQSGTLAQLRPTFTETGHEPPPTAQPAPRAGVMQYADVAVLLLALCAASFIALRLRSRRWMVTLAICSMLYFGFYRLGCVCPVGSIQNMAEALAGHGYVVPLSVVLFFALPLVFTLFFGRTFCAAVCPLGVLQELVVIRPRRLPLHIRRPLEMLPWLYLALAVVMAASGGGYLICRYDPFIGIYRLGGPFPIMLFGALLLAVGTVIGRPYCRFLCPYGALLGLCSRVSHRHVSITPAGCVQCRLCETACPYDAILTPTPAKAPEPRARSIRRFLLLLALAPLLVGGGGWLGSRLAVPLSRLSDTVNLAEQVRLAEQRPDAPLSVEVDGFRRTREDAPQLYERALAIRRRLKTGGGWLGVFTGITLAGHLLGLAIRQARRDYVPDRGQCVSCTRCFSACPVKPPVCPERLTTGSPSIRQPTYDTASGGRGCAGPSPDKPSSMIIAKASERMHVPRPAACRASLADALLGVCLVAAVFTVVIGGVTVLTHRQLRVTDPLNAPALVELRLHYADGARDDETKAILRTADLAARQQYFGLRQRLLTGGWLALAGAIVMIGAWGLRTVAQKPAIPPAPQTCEGMRMLETEKARWSVAGGALLLAAIAAAAAFSSRSPLGGLPKKAEIDSTTNDQEPMTKNQYWSPTFRGAGGSGLTSYGNLPLDWNEQENRNIRWRHALELPAWASPVVAGNRVIALGADADRREVYCIHADTGERLWTTTIPPHADATPNYQPDTMDDRWNTLVFAGATPAVTEKQAFAIFSNGQLAALDLATGEVQWNRVPARTTKNPFGLDNSLLTYEDSVIVVFEGDERFIARYDAATGREIWKTARATSSWASPILANTADGRALVVLLSDPDVTAWDAATGAVAWSEKVLRRKPDYVAGPSPIHVDGRIFVNCQNSGIYALSLADGSLLWKLEELPDRHGFADGAGMVSDGRHLFQFYEFVLTCVNMETGEVVRQTEVDAFAGYASPAADSGRLFLFGDTLSLVVDADPESGFAVLGKGEINGNVDASPAVTDGRIFLRTDNALYAIGSE